MKAVPQFRSKWYRPLSLSWPVFGKPFAHVGPLYVKISASGRHATKNGVVDELPLYPQVPLVRFELRGDERRPPSLARLENLEEVNGVDGPYRRRQKVVDDEQLHGLEAVHCPVVASVGRHPRAV